MPIPRITAWIGTILWLPRQLPAESIQNQSITPPSSVISTENLLQLSAGLLIVLAFIVLIAWLLKKIEFNLANRAGLLKIIASIGVGQKERVVVIEIEDTQLVLGVTPGQINLLHQINRKTPLATEVAEFSSVSSFKEKLQTHLEQNHGREN